MIYVWTTFFVTLLLAANALNIFGLPGNWIIAIMSGVWVFYHPEGSMGWWMIGGFFAMATVAEIAEFLLQSWSAKKFGASGRGNWGGIIGAVVGAILGAPLFFGLGALPGALVGAYVGCLLIEMLNDRPFTEARKAATGAFFGKSIGLTLKLSMGLAMLALATREVWPV